MGDIEKIFTKIFEDTARTFEGSLRIFQGS